MKSTTTTALLGALLATTSALAHFTPSSPLFRRAEAEEWDPTTNFTPEQLEWAMSEDGLAFPQCADTCYDYTSSANQAIAQLTPLCAGYPVSYEEDDTAQPATQAELMNHFSCMCLDRIWLHALWSCYAKACGNNPQAMQDLFQYEYYVCLVGADVKQPKPAALFEQLCLDEDKAPETLPELEDLFKYEYEERLLPNTATSYITQWAVTQTADPNFDVKPWLSDARPTPTCEAGKTFGADPDGTGDAQPTNGGNGTTNGGVKDDADKDDGDDSAARGAGVGAAVWAMGAVAGLVGVVAAVL